MGERRALGINHEKRVCIWRGFTFWAGVKTRDGRKSNWETPKRRIHKIGKGSDFVL